MWRDPVWLQRGLDALKATLDVEPVLKQQMIDFLLEEGFWDRRRLSDAAARTRFNACLNPGKPDFFKIGEVWALMKRFRRYELLHAMCADMGFEPLVQIPPRARRAELMRRLQERNQQHAAETAAIELELTMLESEEGDSTPAVRSDGVRVHPAMREPGPAFALREPGPTPLDEPDEVSGPGAF